MRDVEEWYSAAAKPACGRGAALCAIVAALAIAASAAALESSRRSLAALDARAAAVDRDWADAAGQVKAAMDLRHAQQSIVRQAECAETLLEKNPRSAILADVTNALPAGCWLERLTLDAADVDSSADAAADENVRVTVTGFAPGESAVSKFVLQLRQSNLLHDVKLRQCDSAAQTGMNLNRFRVDLCVGRSDGQPKPVAGPTQTASIGH
jgi:Tfp pilus assembly protein PilN